MSPDFFYKYSYAFTTFFEELEHFKVILGALDSSTSISRCVIHLLHMSCDFIPEFSTFGPRSSILTPESSTFASESITLAPAKYSVQYWSQSTGLCSESTGI